MAKAAKRKDGEENESFEGWADAKKLAMLQNI